MNDLVPTPAIRLCGTRQPSFRDNDYARPQLLKARVWGTSEAHAAGTKAQSTTWDRFSRVTLSQQQPWREVNRAQGKLAGAWSPWPPGL